LDGCHGQKFYGEISLSAERTKFALDTSDFLLGVLLRLDAAPVSPARLVTALWGAIDKYRLYY
jgi:hypothetical protein